MVENGSGFSEFMDDPGEPRAVHKGIYDGLRTWRIRTLKKRLLVGRKAFKVWEEDEGHYHDLAMLVSYSLKYVSIGLAGYIWAEYPGFAGKIASWSRRLWESVAGWIL